MSGDPYEAFRWHPAAGESLIFDDQYRVAQLPLIAPQHPRSLESMHGRDYVMGRYSRARVSLVADLGRPFLAQQACQRLLGHLVDSSFADKIAFDVMEARSANLHCTLVGDLLPTQLQREAIRRLLHDASVLTPIVHGPFIGRFNRGRIYLPLEFAHASDRVLLGAMSTLLRRGQPAITAVGLVNFKDELDQHETLELIALLEDARVEPSEISVATLSWTSTHDDLVLDMRRLETITLRRVDDRIQERPPIHRPWD